MEFEMILGFVLLQRGDFYESLVDYLLPLLKKPSEEIINTMNANSNNQLKIFNIFMVNSKLIDLNQLYKIDSLMFDNFDLHENLQFTFNNSKNIMKHHLGWDCFSVRYKFTKNVYRIMLDDQLHRYERLFKQLFYMKRVLFSIRKAQHQVMHFNSIYKRANPDPKRKSFSSLTPKMSKLVKCTDILGVK
ncbi:Spc97-like protein [Sarcoptes scabiei]|uniref:Spc97-like protein n=1 Tax=Sarcoptes scabiei TaxID=52283 RepID=A0A132AHG8_SARSC|nr:Spc97-like protein [Sarcoptes scabiei]